MRTPIGLLLCAALLSHQAVAHAPDTSQRPDTDSFNTLCNNDVSSLLTPDILDYYLWACQTAPREQGST